MAIKQLGNVNAQVYWSISFVQTRFYYIIELSFLLNTKFVCDEMSFTFVWCYWGLFTDESAVEMHNCCFSLLLVFNEDVNITFISFMNYLTIDFYSAKAHIQNTQRYGLCTSVSAHNLNVYVDMCLCNAIYSADSNYLVIFDFQFRMFASHNRLWMRIKMVHFKIS